MAQRSVLNGRTVLALVAEVTRSTKMMPWCYNWCKFLLLTPCRDIYFTPKKRKTLQSGRHAYFACKGQFVGINTACLECDLANDIIQKIQYEGKSRSWNWYKHCPKFHVQMHVIDEWATDNKATQMFNEDQISVFLVTIPKDCKNSELLITKDIIEGDRSWFLTLVGNVISQLMVYIEAKEHSAPAAKRTIVNTISVPGQCSNKHSQTRRASCMTAGQCCLVDGKVVGTIEGLHYTKDIWKAITSEQKVKILLLYKSKSMSPAMKVMSTAMGLDQS